MEYTASDLIEMRDNVLREVELRELEQWSEETPADAKNKQNKHRGKKRRKPLRKNRKPTRPENYIGQRNNNRLLKICAKD